mmetsp:Transcript_9146/g.17466  ORF Transcript_9146/g.17466 Transcript_9146/m.17466 type:complete len:162 (+) Transcript_9146:95-580(+)|eukprot:CAMPEP_0172712560 /NCGR_PEP_ID=MMETSP1074-20121228/61172_1 /TAXON_ID=2916 /ORGANISM="Ceratium fusus, Strain PA161109" /LENGTH=161 /DNA_ID=CAMNT_0013536507 /DNA_START=92 /DNA_END=577 /DNA_ORIENTATION=+
MFMAHSPNLVHVTLVLLYSGSSASRPDRGCRVGSDCHDEVHSALATATQHSLPESHTIESHSVAKIAKASLVAAARGKECDGGGDGWKCDGSSNGKKKTEDGKTCKVECTTAGSKPKEQEVICNNGSYNLVPSCSGAFLSLRPPLVFILVLMFGLMNHDSH